MKEKWKKIGSMNCKFLTIESKDLPEIKHRKITKLKCLILGHEDEQLGAVGTFVYPADEQEIEGNNGNAGSYARFCQRCGRLKLNGITML